MRFTFLTCLFGLLVAALAITVGYSHVRFSAFAESRAAQTMSARLNDLMELLVHSDEHLNILRKTSEASALDRTRAAAEIIRLNPGILQDEDALQGLCNDIGAKQLFVTDDKGVFTVALPASMKGGDISGFDRANAFMECVRSAGEEATQHSEDAAEDFSLLYTAVHRADAPGALILGFQGPKGQSLGAASSYANLAQNYNLGARGHIIAFKDGALLGEDASPFPTADLISLPLNQGSTQRLGDADYFTYAIRQHGYHLVGVMPVEELRKGSLRSLYPVLASNAALFLTIFFLVFYLLQRLVLRNISKLNTSLRKIAQGHANLRTEMQDSPIEFRRLSQNINAMVDALQMSAKRSDDANARDMELARSIQDSIIHHTSPAFPEQSDFEVAAFSRRAKIVGGGVYDYFMQGEDHLYFMVADTPGSGVPAALFSTHSLSLLRDLAHSGAELSEIVCQANAELCAAQFSGISLSLFIGVLNIRTGQLTYINADMPQALVCRKGDSYVFLDMQICRPLGQSPESAYYVCSHTLAPGDRLFLYSKGVVDATDEQQIPFGMAHLQETLDMPAATPTELIRRLNQIHRKYTLYSEQSLDVVALALEFIGRQNNNALLSFPAGQSSPADDFIAAHLESVFASPPAISAVQQAVQRISAALPPACPVELALEYNEETALATLTYPAPLFNALASLGELGVDQAQFDFSSGSNTISLSQSLA